MSILKRKSLNIDNSEKWISGKGQFCEEQLETDGSGKEGSSKRKRI